MVAFALDHLVGGQAAFGHVHPAKGNLLEESQAVGEHPPALRSHDHSGDLAVMGDHAGHAPRPGLLQDLWP